MKVFNKENILAVDIDGTLIDYPKKSDTAVTGDIFLAYGDKLLHLRPMQMNIALMKHCKKVREYGILVWSANGKDWAIKVLDALGLTEYADIIMTKPIEYLDDKPVEQWMTNRIHLEDK